MTYKTLISIDKLYMHIEDKNWVIVDCRFDLLDSSWGELEYLSEHIPGAIYADLNRDLSGKIIPGKTGRHPLPPVDEIAHTFGSWGIGYGVQVVAYDSWPKAGNAVAARLWWLLRWLGHSKVAVLDGGWPAWQTKEYPSKSNIETHPAREFIPRLRLKLFATTSEVEHALALPDFRLYDSRNADRYRGENETIDPIAGHIPGAISAPFVDNHTPDGRWLPVEKLRDRFQLLLGEVPPERAIFYCGSGVTAAMNLLALAHAGLGDAKLYAGSWSEWITDQKRSIVLGDEYS